MITSTEILHFGKYKNELRNKADKIQIDETKSLESYHDDFISAVKEATVKSALAVKRKHHCTPKKSWITGNILDLIKERDLMFRKWKNSKTENREIVRQKYIIIRNNVQKEITSAKLNYYSTKFREVRKDIKSTWALVNEISGKQKSKSVDEVIEKYFFDSFTGEEI